MKNTMESNNNFDSEAKYPRNLMVSSLVIAIIGILGLPLAVIAVNSFAPHLIHSSMWGDIDPVSSLFFILTILLLPVAAILMTVRSFIILKGRSSKNGGSGAGRVVLGLIATFMLFPLGYEWATFVFSVLRP